MANVINGPVPDQWLQQQQTPDWAERSEARLLGQRTSPTRHHPQPTAAPSIPVGHTGFSLPTDGLNRDSTSGKTFHATAFSPSRYSRPAFSALESLHRHAATIPCLALPCTCTAPAPGFTFSFRGGISVGFSKARVWIQGFALAWFGSGGVRSLLVGRIFWEGCFLGLGFWWLSKGNCLEVSQSSDFWLESGINSCGVIECLAKLIGSVWD